MCNGKGRVPGKKKGTVRCACLLRQEAIIYLTDIYANAKYIKGLNANLLKGKNLFIDQDAQRTFKAAIKSFLLNTGMKYRHMTVSAHDILTFYLGKMEGPEYRTMESIDILILYLVADPRSKSYGDIIISILEKRNLRNLPTWVFTNKLISSQQFKDAYSIKLSNFLTKNFNPLRGLSKQIGT